MSLVQHTLLQKVWADKDCLNLCNDKNRRHLPPVFIVLRSNTMKRSRQAFEEGLGAAALSDSPIMRRESRFIVLRLDIVFHFLYLAL